MYRVIMFATFMLLVGCATASAAPVDLTEISSSTVHVAITVLGLLLAGWLAIDAFNRPSVKIGDEPTFPRYMTSRGQYRLGSFVFVLFACSFFLLLVYEHRDIVGVVTALDSPGVVPKALLEAVKDQSTPYLMVIFFVGAIYIYLLVQEVRWNPLLMMRDVIQHWISIPQLVGSMVSQIESSLRVRDQSVAEVLARHSGLVIADDFAKDRSTTDRIWAETCYMEWWINQRLERGADATFFSENSFCFDPLKRSLQDISTRLGRLTGTAQAEFKIAMHPEIDTLHQRFSRLVACYLVYRNGSPTSLSADADEFGINLNHQNPENPLRYWIVYAIALIVSVYIGVYISAVSFDLLSEGRFDPVQDPNRSLAWAMYTLSNFGFSIFIILLIRFALRSLEVDAGQSHLITYCWTFLVAFALGPLGLTVAVHFFGEGQLPELALPRLYFELLKWGLGPALVCVYISYYLDRQTCHDLPNIDHSSATFAWRLLNCSFFAALVVFLLLPPLLGLKTQPDATWPTEKLRFVAAGCTFFVALGLALAAQFALRKGTDEAIPQLATAAVTPH